MGSLKRSSETDRYPGASQKQEYSLTGDDQKALQEQGIKVSARSVPPRSER